MVAIKQQLVSSRTITSGEGNPCNFITIHETGNYDKGVGAQRHADLQTNGFTASWQYQVDDKVIIQSYPDSVRCWHAGDGNGKGNMESIGIEICVNPDSDFKKAVANAAELVKHLMKKHNIPLTNVVQHNRWSGKNCPTNLRSGAKGINWSGFIYLVSLKQDKPIENKPVAVTPPKVETGPVKNIPSAGKPSTPNTGHGIVDWMNINKMDSSYANRAKLAKEYGIDHYSGTAAQNTELLAKLKGGKPSKPVEKPIEKPVTKPVQSESVVDYMNSKGMNSGFANRKKLATQYGIKNYSGTAAQNITLLNKLQGGVVVNKPKGNQKTTSVVDYLNSIGQDSGFNNRAKLAKKHGIKNYTGTAGQNTALLNKLRK
ncbi:N-acetylmuramoyl-L-alanine amidase [Bacillus sp. FSL K6-3431]|uniref:N-acetylmuramoyl-L-alanine amidase n=1 Tax=Bacillus sp. FSL K6-3431 TaxID=2921500 RepID=UPI0030FC332D